MTIRRLAPHTPAARPHGTSAPLGDVRFRRLIPDEDWRRLPEAIRARFSHGEKPGGVTAYAGEIIDTRMTWYGRLLANILRIAGAPLPLETDNAGAAAMVAVTERNDGRGQFWTRQYASRSGFPQVIHSTKVFAGPTGLEETVGCGVTMSLRLAAGPDRLLFVSERFALKMGHVRLPIPGGAILGRIIVGHVAAGADAFEFTLEVRHPWLGLIVYQRALFHDLKREEAPPC